MAGVVRGGGGKHATGQRPFGGTIASQPQGEPRRITAPDVEGRGLALNQGDAEGRTKTELRSPALGANFSKGASADTQDVGLGARLLAVVLLALNSRYRRQTAFPLLIGHGRPRAEPPSHLLHAEATCAAARDFSSEECTSRLVVRRIIGPIERPACGGRCADVAMASPGGRSTSEDGLALVGQSVPGTDRGARPSLREPQLRARSG